MESEWRRSLCCSLVVFVPLSIGLLITKWYLQTSALCYQHHVLGTGTELSVKPTMPLVCFDAAMR